MIPMPYNVTGTSATGVTIESLADGGIKCTGTAESSAYFTLYGGYAIQATPIPTWLVEGETYTISGGTTKVGIAMFLYKEDGTAWQAVGSPESTFVMPSGYSYIGIFVFVPTGNTVDETVYPMLNAGSTATDYEPYTGCKPAPSPDYPQELANLGNGGSIVVSVTGENDAKSMTIVTPNGLPGIPVDTGGNYTDANGQQWICDEIDLARGVYVQRTKSGNLYEYFERCTQFDNTNYSEDVLRFDFSNAFDSKIHTKVLCNRFVFRFAHGNDNVIIRAKEGVSSHSTNDIISVFIDKNRLVSATLDGFKTYLQNNVTIVRCVINTPIETTLSEEEFAAYSALHTYRNHTTVSNDASAHMELEYVMDAKKYIDSLMAGGIHPATVE
jgi:hypothetical protein